MSEASANTTSVPSRIDRVADGLKTHERQILIMSACAQLVILAGMIVLRAIPYLTGDTVLLQVVPVDPRDMFRGDYVILSYEFSRIPPGEIPSLSDPRDRRSSTVKQEQAVYVSILPDADGQHYRMGTFSQTPPPTGKYLRGTRKGWNQMEFGIESFFVQEGTGYQYEDAIRNHRLWAEVSVTSNGTAVLKGLHIE